MKKEPMTMTYILCADVLKTGSDGAMKDELVELNVCTKYLFKFTQFRNGNEM